MLDYITHRTLILRNKKKIRSHENLPEQYESHRYD